MYYILKHIYRFDNKINKRNYDEVKKTAYKLSKKRIICHSISLDRVKEYFYDHYANDCFYRNVFVYFTVADEYRDLVFSNDFLFL